MSTTFASRAATTTDRVRASLVLVAAVGQIVAGGLGGAGAFGLSVGVVAQQNTTVVMPAPGAFSIWGPIYAAILLLAVRQALPGQLARPVHRATGWWLVASAVFNAGWIVVFSLELVALAQVVIVALLVTLAVTLARLTAHRAAGVADRLLLHGPVALYTGWVSVATVVGAATTGTFLGADGRGVVAILLGVAVLLATGAIAGAVAAHAAGSVPYAASVVWALGGIVVMGPPVAVVVAALVALAAVAAVVVRRVLAAGRGQRVVAAFG